MSAIAGVARYERVPTRFKLQLFWSGMVILGCGWEFHQLTMNRVKNKREEQSYVKLKETYGDNVPPELLEVMKRQRENQDAITLTNVLQTPTPGEVCGSLQHELDPRRLAALRSANGY